MLEKVRALNTQDKVFDDSLIILLMCVATNIYLVNLLNAC